MTDYKSVRSASAAITLALLAAQGLTTTAANAAVDTWANVGTAWSVASNWVGAVPGSLDVAQFNSGSYVFQPVLSSTNTAGAVWESGSGSLVIQGGVLGLFGATVNGAPSIGLESDSGGGGLTISSVIVLNGSQTWTNNSSVPMNIMGNVNTISNRLLTITGSGDTLIGGVISGAGLITKSGASNLTFLGTNSYTGTTTVSAGTLQIGKGPVAGSLASGSLVNVDSGAALLYSGTNNQNLGNNFFGTGTWSVAGSPSTVFSITGSAVGFGGTLNVNSGILSIATTAVGGLARVPSSSASVNVASGAEFLLIGGTCNSSATINGSGPPNGAALGFSGTATYGGGITLAGDAQVSSSGITTIIGNIGGSHQLSLFGPNSASLIRLQGNNSYGSTLLSGSNNSVMVLSSSALSSGPLSFSGPSTLLTFGNNLSVASLSGSAGHILNGSASASSTLSVGSDNSSTSFGGTIGDGGSLPLALRKVGTGSLALGGANTFTGSTNLSAGTLLLANTAGSALGSSSLTLNSGELASAAGTAGGMSGLMFAGSGSHIISPGGDGPIGSLGVGGLTINAFSTMRFDIAGVSGIDQVNDAGSLAFSGTGAASVLVPNSVPVGLYKLMSYNSTSIDPSELSLGIIGGGTAPVTYQLLLNPNELDLAVVPEPSTLALLAVGALGLAAVARRRRKR